ncbi:MULTISPECIES: bifunctional riboflavin kinase/FAD synthetase [unclassified Duganella]|uniref:bifunctional riboflavin kinase/FAD synthetase n=1 Tax=unclassified Duganella TaxID=2636909 RepID=UPI0006FF7C6B|nr:MULTISPECIES: bifunctional riboflavin kinase/FAD synthetase [unclassified Duganella]KQV54189.1 bifunctional riboflavin kinase/FMN adenylyltransferase [Duganella sp. Root336D2]KRC03318.1 bifunctional riboflavin kinase/FMN adenylyltransferase [Duganella sp. Root198D2]
MKVFRGLPNAAARAPCALTIGNFDGVHRGHQALLARVRAAADQLGLESAVMTFEPHPREFFARKMGDMSKAPPRIANLRDKLQALENNGVDRVIVEHFCDAFAGQSPQAFVEKVLVEGLHVKWLMVGDDFCYGAKRAGNVALLAEAGRQYGFEVAVLATVRNGETRISSSAVRTALAEGDFPHAQALLGHPYSISGHVIHGAKLGRDIGFPTLNLRVPHRPALAGIFIVQVHGLGDKPLPAVASLGVRPTVEDAGRVLLEVHVFDFARNCYGKVVRVEFLQKIRDEEKFIDLPTLVKAIERDADQARAFFAANSVTDRI